MLDHLSIQCDDAAASARFYDAVLAAIGGSRIKEFGPVIGYGTNAPTFWIAPRTDAGPNRQSHIAFRAATRAEVDAFVAAAVAQGLEVLHEPRVWPEYHPDYYGGFRARPRRQQRRGRLPRRRVVASAHSQPIRLRPRP